MQKKRDNKCKINLFKSVFHGLKGVYGTYDPVTGKYRQVKCEASDDTIYKHLKGDQPYGFYPLNGKITSAGIADFDDPDPEKPIAFYSFAKDWGFTTYIEQSKSKGHHVWMFFKEPGVEAKKVRRIMHWLLEEIGAPSTEIFPKQNEINPEANSGNFINAPLFGKLVLEGKTVFLNPEDMKPYANQYEVLENIKRIPAKQLDYLIKTEIGDKLAENSCSTKEATPETSTVHGYPLPICIRRILENGVTHNQRVACFRIAVNLKLVGIPQDIAEKTIIGWSEKNKPHENKQIITPEEIRSQTEGGYKNKYTGYGCNEPVIGEFCDPQCPVSKKSH
ncbi:hypothetical protein ACFL6P_04425 [Candidatus Latescibacterota bacterium]